LSVIGTRPEAIKMAPVLRELARRGDRVRSVVCATGQHREMLDRALGLFGIAPDYDLRAMRPGQSLSRLTARLLAGLDRVLDEVAPDWVLAQGDTTTVLAASLAAYYRRRKFGHVEAGLRTGDVGRPFPEEVNRRVADLVADAYFAPTERARRALLAEGVPDGRIFVTGNTVVDAVREVASRPYDWSAGPLAGLPRDGRLVLVTAHRRESFGEPLREVCAAIRDLAEGPAGRGVHFAYPVHPNPEARAPAEAILAGVPNVRLLGPLDYPDLVHLMARSELILTDSGGVQEEAPGLGVPVLVLRETTERPEGIEAGVARLVGTRRDRIVAEAETLLGDPAARAALTARANPYGDGRAAARIVDALVP
jgi:UDP-N-acetylglucosamine 2-epimerase